jgi:hypothetical protein
MSRRQSVRPRVGAVGSRQTRRKFLKFHAHFPPPFHLSDILGCFGGSLGVYPAAVCSKINQSGRKRQEKRQGRWKRKPRKNRHFQQSIGGNEEKTVNGIGIANDGSVSLVGLVLFELEEVFEERADPRGYATLE